MDIKFVAFSSIYFIAESYMCVFDSLKGDWNRAVIIIVHAMAEFVHKSEHVQGWNFKLTLKL